MRHKTQFSMRQWNARLDTPERVQTALAVQHGHAVDRFARKIVGFLKAAASALAATDAQTVGPLS